VELLPEARIAIAHGQMPERELEHVMRDFVAQRHNVLLCSTIIETGIDVPSANTIVISRADKFGLAQLHQLRGRVGRSHHQAYAYLMVPDIEGLTKQASMRLEAIQQMEELGSGFYLAMHDLEIRGAGEVLGENQSGNMLEVGFQLYNEMLTEAVRSLKSGKEPSLMGPLTVTTEVNLHAPALLPESYCGDVHLRLSFYKKLASAGKKTPVKGIVLSVVAGVLMGFFYSFVAQTMGKIDGVTHALEASKLSPYTAIVLFSAGLLASNFIWNTIAMAKPFSGEPVTYRDYFTKGNLRLHLIGILGGMIWNTGMGFSIIASTAAGPALSYGLGQGATMVGALWGVFIWKEFKGAPQGTGKLLGFMFLFYIIGLAVLIASKL
jgi:hypothetical protein